MLYCSDCYGPIRIASLKEIDLWDDAKGCNIAAIKKGGPQHMEETALITSMAILLLSAAVCSLVTNRLKLPPLIGYLIAGIILANVWTVDEMSETIVEVMSDMGLIVLMFCIGMEINFKKIREQGLFAIVVALVQLPSMVLGGVVAGTFMGFDMVQSICLGGIISGSSTAVVMAVLKTQNRLDKDQIDTIVLITIMEDIGQVIILSMITPLMAGNELDAVGLAVMVLSIMTFMIVSIVVGVRFVPRIMNWISDNVSFEVLMILSLGMAFGMAMLANYAGLSVAIGAFLMGMMLSPSRNNKKLNRDFEPMKSILMSMFFISVGMEISLHSLWENILLIIGLYLLFAFLKSGTVFLGYWIGGESPRNGFLSAIGLVAMGEFAFIIAKQALDHSVVDEGFYTSVIGAALISMMVLPIMTKSSERIWDRMVDACPAGALDALRRMNGSRDSLYHGIAMSSKRTKKEFRRLMIMNYMSVLLIFIVEILFVLINPALAESAEENIGETAMVWSILMLLINLIGIYLPTYMIVNNLRKAKELGEVSSGVSSDAGKGGNRLSITDMFTMSSTTTVSAMVAIAVLILVPNNLGMQEHLVVLILALAGLFLYNRERLQKMIR